MDNTTVCVTGASGFIASHIVLQLLQKGYRVNATIRSLKNKDKIGFLEEFSVKFPKKLYLFEADLLTEGSFDEAIKGCKYVIHTASPATFTAKKGESPYQAIVAPALKGTENVLKSCEKAGTVKKLVLTSSIAAVRSQFVPAGQVYTEKDWNNDLDKMPYYEAKTKAEQLAWDFVEKLPADKKFELITILPSLVIGPMLSNNLANSNSVILTVASGQYPAAPRIAWNLVDVRDVAKAHVVSMESDKAKGRYIVCFHENKWLIDIANIIRKQFQQLPNVPTRVLPDVLTLIGGLFDKRVSLAYLKAILGKESYLSNAKARIDLGIDFIPNETSIVDTTNSLLERGFLTTKKSYRRTGILLSVVVAAGATVMYYAFGNHLPKLLIK